MHAPARASSSFRRILPCWATMALLVALPIGVAAAGSATPAPLHPLATPRVGTPVSISSFQFSPSQVSTGTQTHGNVTLSGGTPPYYLWFNYTPPGCSPPSNPVTTQAPYFPFNCQPSSPGNFVVHLDVVDSSAPATRDSRTANLVVTSNTGGNGNNGSGGNGAGKGNGSFQLPSGLFQFVILLAIAFLASMFLLAGGMIATAALVSRRLRQLNETLAKSTLPPKEPKPPT